MENEGQVALVFINVRVLDAFVAAEELHMDGKIFTAPRIFHQLATLHTIAYGCVSKLLIILLCYYHIS